jgi:DNA-binding transcriptional regulator/RsmH inhibitor MraZ
MLVGRFVMMESWAKKTWRKKEWKKQNPNRDTREKRN